MADAQATRACNNDCGIGRKAIEDAVYCGVNSLIDGSQWALAELGDDRGVVLRVVFCPQVEKLVTPNMRLRETCYQQVRSTIEQIEDDLFARTYPSQSRDIAAVRSSTVFREESSSRKGCAR